MRITKPCLATLWTVPPMERASAQPSVRRMAVKPKAPADRVAVRARLHRCGTVCPAKGQSTLDTRWTCESRRRSFEGAPLGSARKS